MTEKSPIGVENLSVESKKNSKLSQIFVKEIKPIFTEPRRLKSLMGAIVARGIVRTTSVLAEMPDNVGTKTSINIEGEMPSQNEGLRDEIFSQFPDYVIKQQETEAFKEKLREKECQDINLDFCADFLYSRSKSDGFKSPGVYDLWQKTILGDYVTDEQIYEFGRTGKGLDVVYFKDKKGKKTKEPAIAYVVTPDVKKFKISDIEKAIDFWEKVAPGFLKAMVANDVRVLFHGQASSNKKIGGFKYEYGIIYANNSETRADRFSNNLRRGLAVEMFGVKGDALGGDFDKDEVAVIKSWLARDCSYYIGKKTGNSNIIERSESYQMELDRYMTSGKFTPQYMRPIIERIKKENLMIPFGAETWEEIDSINK